MKTRAKGISMVAAAAVAAIGSVAVAQTEYNWNTWSAGTHNWNTAANWVPSGFPQNANDTGNIMGPAAGNILINVSNNVSLGRLTLGATGSPTTINVGSTGGHLRFVNTGVQGGDPVPTPSILSGGVAGATNIINAPILFGQPGETGITTVGNVEILNSSTNSLTLSGLIRGSGDFNRHIINNMSSPHTLSLAGDMQLWEMDIDGVTQLFRGLIIRGSGHTHVTGSFIPADTTNATGQIQLGQTSNADLRSLITLSGNNPSFSRETLLLRAVVVLDHDYAVGTGQFRANTGNNNFLAEIHSSSDDRVLQAQLGLVRPITVAGEHSLTLGNGFLGRSGSNPLVNLLPDGKTLTIEGNVFLWNSNEANRNSQFDGTGLTVINGPVFNNHGTDDSVLHPTNFFKRGTGTLVLNNTNSTYAGNTQAQGGLLLIGPSDSGTGNAAWGQTSEIIAFAGAAVGMVNGSADANWNNFLTLLSSDSRGALALAPSDSAMNVDFNSGALAGMSLGAQSAVNYTGTITPANNTYRLGGGDTLTLPNNSQLTGANSLVVANGGTVRLTGTNDLSGSVQVMARYITSDQGRAEARLSGGGITQVHVPTVLSVTNLANGGSASSIGTSSSDAANLLIQGSTLRYEGAGSSTDRLLTVGTAGATLDASGSGAVNFTNTGALAMDPAEDRTGTTNSVFDRNQIVGLPTTDDIVIGMPVTGPGIPENTIVTGILSETAVQMSALVAQFDPNAGTGTITFGPFPRTLSLAGTSAAANRLAPVIQDSTTGPVIVDKTGTGTWVLAGNNTYSGGTNVEAGRLVIGHANALGSGEVNVGAAGTLAVQQGFGTHTMSLPNMEPGARLDITNNEVVIQGSDLSTVHGLVASGRAGGSWTGPGIGSSSAGSQSGRAVGMGPSGSDVIVKFTWGGDATLDGTVTIADLGILAANWQQSSRMWHQGDFNYDGLVDIADLGILAGNWQAGTSGGMSFEAALAMFDVFDGVVVPEPSALGLLGLGVLALRRRRRAASTVC
jgi:autotransporter-associated beta strand protein